MKKKTFLVTGGTGFIGSNISNFLVQKNYNVKIFDNNSRGSIQKIKSFKKIFPNFIYELEFEKFVENPEIESKKLMQYCELPWDKKCLEYYKRKDLVSSTASNIQIREAIYKDKKEKHLPYKEFLNKYGQKYYWFNGK